MNIFLCICKSEKNSTYKKRTLQQNLKLVSELSCTVFTERILI